MKIFVSGATGFQGSSIAQQLIANEHRVVTLKRDPSKETTSADGIEVVKGGLEDPTALKEAMKGVNAAVYSFPLIFDMELAKTYTENFIAAAKEQSVSLVVFNATFDLPTSNTGLLALDMKVAIKALLDSSELNVITLVPDIYIDNLAAPWSIPVILNNNILPYPVASGKKIPWISHTDLARYIASAVEKPELSGQVLPIGGNLLTGEEIAAAITAKINTPVNFVSVTVDDFQQQLIPGFGELAAQEISNLYRFVEQNHNHFVSKDFAKTNEVLRVKPQTLDEWVDSVKWTM